MVSSYRNDMQHVRDMSTACAYVTIARGLCSMIGECACVRGMSRCFLLAACVCLLCVRVSLFVLYVPRAVCVCFVFGVCFVWVCVSHLIPETETEFAHQEEKEGGERRRSTAKTERCTSHAHTCINSSTSHMHKQCECRRNFSSP